MQFNWLDSGLQTAGDTSSVARQVNYCELLSTNLAFVRQNGSLEVGVRLAQLQLSVRERNWYSSID